MCPPEPITLSVPPQVPGPDIWDRSTCPWESFSEEGLSSPDDTHGNTCHTWATGHFFCKRCKNPHGYHPRKWRGKVRERTKKVKCECWHAHSGHVYFRKTSCAPSNMLQKYSRKVGNTRGTALTCSTQLTLGRGSVLKLEFTEKPCHHLGPNSLYSTYVLEESNPQIMKFEPLKSIHQSVPQYDTNNSRYLSFLGEFRIGKRRQIRNGIFFKKMKFY